MEIGISSACFYPDCMLEDTIKIMKDLGFNIGEIFINTPSECEESFIIKLKEEADKQNFRISSVHFFSSMYEPFLFDVYDRRRKDAFKLYKKLCKATKILGASSYTFHGVRSVDSQNLKMDFILDIYNELCYIAAENEVYLSQENVSWCMSSNVNFLNLLREKIKYPLKYTFDIKQAYKSNVDPVDYLNVMEKELINFHINDKSNNSVCELPGNGDVEYVHILNKLKEIKYDKVAILEVYRSNFDKYDELVKCRKFLQDLL